MSSSSASGTKSLISGERFSVRLPRRIVAICVSEPIGLRVAAADALDAGHERRGDGAEAGREDAELAGGGTWSGGSVCERNLARTYSPLSRWARGAAARARTEDAPRSRRALPPSFRSSGRRIDERHALDHGDPGRDGQNDDDDRRAPSRRTRGRRTPAGPTGARLAPGAAASRPSRRCRAPRRARACTR